MTAALKVLCFLIWGNFLPPLANLVAGDRFNRPLDKGWQLPDGEPLFGSHKTIRGIIVSLLGGTALFPLLGVTWPVAAAAAALLMTGDLLTSFIKRRLHYPSGSAVAGLDQFLEGLLPTLFLGRHLQLSLGEQGLVLLLFIPITHLGALFWKTMLHRPPAANYPRRVRSTVRLKEWRACHQPLARWHVWLHPTSFFCNRLFLTFLFKGIGRYADGMAQARAIEFCEQEFFFADLPAGFDGFRILLLTDLHLDGQDGLTEAIIDRIDTLTPDLCLIGGDIRMKTFGPIAPSLRHLRCLLGHVHTRHPVLGVLGNHDCIEMVPDFEEAGMLMLVNDAWQIKENGDSLWIVGVDDPHYYRTDDADHAFQAVPADGFAIFLAHSPEAYQQAARHPQARLYLCGHTHAGQIRLPGSGAIFTNSRAPRFTAEGFWRFGELQGYTCRGAGSSSVPLRFHCPPEITLLTLRRNETGT